MLKVKFAATVEELEELLEDFILKTVNFWVNFMVIPEVGGIVGRAVNLSYLVSNTVVISQNASITGSDIGGIVGQLT